MLEKFVCEPSLLTDDDIMELLISIFKEKPVRNKLDFLIEERKKIYEIESN